MKTLNTGSGIARLKSRLRISDDKATRVLYSTDASIYRCEPLGVFFPRDEADLVRAVTLAAECGVTVLPRGAGTSLSGQAITSGLIVDLSGFRGIRIEQGAGPPGGGAQPRGRDLPASCGDRAHVGPGVIIDDIDRAAAPFGLRFGPTPASSNRATIGGLLANNGTGARSIKFGMASDHLLAARVLLSDGSIREFRRGELHAGNANNANNDELTSKTLAISDRFKDSARWPKTWRNASGLDLRGIYKRQSLLPLFCGSEGSLGMILDAEISLVPKPKSSQLAIFFYDDLVKAMEHVPALIETGPSAIELMDRYLLELARNSPRYNMRVIKTGGPDHPAPAAMLIVEYEDVDQSQVARDLGAAMIFDDPADQADVWNSRREGLGILMSGKSSRKPLPFIEDCAVPVEKLPEYVTRLSAIIRKHGTEGAYYAHASAGCLHIRPVLDLHHIEERARMDAIMEETVELVAELGGTLTGEHGDGRSKTPWLERIFGSELVQAFEDVRQIFDPAEIFRPQGRTQLRVDRPAVPVKTATVWERGLLDELERCNGEGACRKKDGVMCPSFQVTDDESLSTRGRTNLLRALLAGEELSPAIDESLSKCLGCKACSSECPSQVDMARLKAEYFNMRGPRIPDRFFANYDLLSKAGRSFGVPFAGLVKRIVGIHPNCDLPIPVKVGFMEQWLDGREGLKVTEAADERCDAVLFVDTHMEYYEPEIGLAAMKIFRAMGLRVRPVFAGCCMRPAFSRGMLAKARRGVESIRIADDNPLMPVIVVEPSCLSMLRDDAPTLAPSSIPLSKRVVSVEAFILDRADKLPLRQRTEQAIFYHSHCHQKSMGKAAEGKRILELAGPVNEINSGCCGMAGAFGYERDNYHLSLAIAEDRFLPALRSAGGSPCAVSGRSCREMAARHGLRVRHPIEILAEKL